MTRACVTVAAGLSFAASLAPRTASAQMIESVGIRAQGMGGAFVALANDATATWWNPAGVAGGPYFNALVEYNQPEIPANTSVRAVALAFPALGLSYYRLPVSQMRPPAPVAAGGTSRQPEGYLNEFGATVDQSIGGHLVIGSTLKLVSADETHGDLDLGALATLGHFRIGVVMRNVTQPTFDNGPDSFSMKRQVRLGGALVTHGGGIIDEFTLAADGDLMEVPTSVGNVQHLSGGAELWAWRRLLGIRGGLSDNLVTHQLSESGGLSYMLQSGRYFRTYLDGQLTRGADQVRRGWGVDVRLTY